MKPIPPVPGPLGGKPLSFGCGWTPDPPELRRASLPFSAAPVQDLLRRVPGYRDPSAAAAVAMKAGRGPDLTAGCSPVEDQGLTNACSACATVGLFEFFLKRFTGPRYLDLSIRYLYKVARDEQGVKGDGGVFLGTAMKCVGTRGVAPDALWPFLPRSLDEEPPEKVDREAGKYTADLQYRIDEDGRSAQEVLEEIRRHLRCGLPCTLGFFVYPSVEPVLMAGGQGPGTEGHVPFPSFPEKPTRGHSVLLVGYDDGRVVGAETGAFRFRNSWGPDWGDGGYGWLPFRYLREGCARDAWSITDEDFLRTAM